MGIKAEILVSPEIIELLSDSEIKERFENYVSETLVKKWLEETDKIFLEEKR